MNNSLITRITGQDGSYLAEFLLKTGPAGLGQGFALARMGLGPKPGLKKSSLGAKIRSVLGFPGQ